MKNPRLLSILAVFLILVTLFLVSGSLNKAKAIVNTMMYVVGAYHWGNSIRGLNTYLTTPDVPTVIIQSELTEYMSIGYVGTNISNKPWVETGAKESLPCSTCEPVYHPRTGWMGPDGVYTTFTANSWNLSPGGWYEYHIQYRANLGNVWRTRIINGSGTALTIKDVPLGVTTALSEVGSGGETWSLDGLIGDISTAQNQVIQWSPIQSIDYCYTLIYYPPSLGGSITPCGNNHDWTIHF